MLSIINTLQINTMPEDFLVFSLVPKDSSIFAKLILENYIGLQSMLNEYVNVRFVDSERMESIHSLNCMFIPKSIIDYQSESLHKLITVSIDNNFKVLVYVDQYYIPFFKAYKRYHTSHYIIIDNYSNKNNIYNCRDFNDLLINNIDVVFEDLHCSVSQYNISNNEKLGLYALKAVDNVTEINFSKFVVETQLLLNQYYSTGYIAYGVACFDVFLQNIKEQELHYEKRLERFFQFMKTIYYSTILWKHRIDILISRGLIQKNLLIQFKALEGVVVSTYLGTVKLTMKKQNTDVYSINLLSKYESSIYEIKQTYVLFINNILADFRY